MTFVDRVMDGPGTACDNGLTVTDNNSRGHSVNLIKYYCTIGTTKYYFSNGVVNVWNSLLVVSAYSVSLCTL